MLFLNNPDIEFLNSVAAEFSEDAIAPRQEFILNRQLSPLAKSMGLNDVSELVRKLRRSSNASLLKRVAEAIAVDDKRFFRDRTLFDALRKNVFPAVIRNNQAGRQIRIWTAACSSGQDPYSIAMLVRENFPQLINWQVEIVATDVFVETMEKAESACFLQSEVERGLSAKRLERFFEREGTNWKVKQGIKNLIQFRRLDLKEMFPPIGPFDIVVMQNVLSNFVTPTKIAILERVHRLMSPEGYLFLGLSESTMGLDVPFQRENVSEAVCYRPVQQ